MKFLCLLAFIPLTLLASELPPSVIPAGVGVNIHFVKGSERDLDMIQAAGFKWIRMDFVWETTEKTKGVYEWADYDELTANLKKRGLRAIYILDYSHPLYEPTGIAPQHPASVAAYADWAAAAAKHFRDQPIVWEIWNEPNGGFWKPKADVAQYTTLAVQAAAKIRAADGSATIVGPACATFDWPFMETFLSSGVLSNLDALTMHPYRDFKLGPETAGPEYDRLRNLIQKYAPTEAKKQMPILSGEWGYSTQHGGASLEAQAAFAVRQQLFNLIHGVPLSIWYDWKNDGKDPNYNENNFGTVTDNLTPKPAYSAIKTMTGELNGFQFKQRIAPRDNDYLLIFITAKGRTLVAWTTDAPHTVSASFVSTNGVDGMGKPFAATMENGKLKIDLEPLPKYFTGK